MSTPDDFRYGGPSPGVLDLDGTMHDADDPNCCGCGYHRGCGGVVHDQGVYGGMLRVCGKCRRDATGEVDLSLSTEPKHPAPWKWVDEELHDANGEAVLIPKEWDGPWSPASPYVEAVTALAPEMEAMLRRLEWAGDDNESQAFCPSCQVMSSYRHKTHAPHCALAIILARIDAAKGTT